MRPLLRDKKGNSVVELALAMPVLCGLLIGMVDLSRGYSAKLQLQQAAQRAIEKVMQTSGSTTVASALKTEAASVAGVNESAVTVSYWLECNGVKQTSYDSVCPAGQTYARNLEVDITKQFVPTFSTRFAGANSDGTYTLQGRAGMRIQ